MEDFIPKLTREHWYDPLRDEQLQSKPIISENFKEVRRMHFEILIYCVNQVNEKWKSF